MRFDAVVAAVVMLAASPAWAQGPRVLAEWLIPGAQPGSADGVAATADGGVVAAGRSGASPRVVRLDAKGRVADDWVLPGSDAWPRAVAALPGALAVVAGPADPPGHEHGIAVWRLQVAEDGRMTQDWLRRFRRTALDGGTGAVALDDGGMVVVGWTGGKAGGAWLLKLDADGEAAWRRLALPFVADGVFEARAAARGEHGDVLVAAYGAANAETPGGVWVLRFDLDGNDYHQKVIDEDGDEQPAALAVLAEGWVVAGRKDGQPWLVRCDAQGDIAWDKLWTGLGGLRAAVSLPDGGVLVAGTRDGAGFLARLGEDGSVMWEKRLANGGLNALTLLPDGTAIAAGERRRKMWLVKVAY